MSHRADFTDMGELRGGARWLGRCGAVSGWDGNFPGWVVRASSGHEQILGMAQVAQVQSSAP